MVRNFLVCLFVLIMSSVGFCETYEGNVSIVKDKCYFKQKNEQILIHFADLNVDLVNYDERIFKNKLQNGKLNGKVKIDGRVRVSETDNSKNMIVDKFTISHTWPSELDREDKKVELGDNKLVIDGITIIQAKDSKQYYYENTQIPAMFLDFGDEKLLGTPTRKLKDEWEYVAKEGIWIRLHGINK